jgi:tetratricopeptide (TPR) repeat protein
MPIRAPIPVAVLIIAVAACSRRGAETTPPGYGDAVTAFYVGLSAMQTTQEALAREKFDRVVALVPQEPAGWANLGLLLVRQQDLEQGAQRLAQAAALAPESAAIQRLQALAESRRGNLAAAIAHWRRALTLDPQDAEAAYALALEIERQGGAANEEEAQRVLEQLVARRENLAARLEYLRIAAKRGDSAALNAGLAPLTAAASAWSPQAQEQLKTLIAAAAGDARAAAIRIAFLKNVLLRDPAYRSARADISSVGGEVGEPIARFLRLKNPVPAPAPADDALTFAVEPLPNEAPSSWAGAVPLTDDGNPVIVAAGAQSIRLVAAARTAGCAGADNSATPSAPLPDGVAAADVNYDFRTDLAIAGASGFCLLRQTDAGGFSDVTSLAKLPAALLRAPAHGVWPADIDTDGDLDLVLAPRDAPPVVLRNNGDDTFTPRDLFAAAGRARGFVWADVDGEGVPDAAFVDQSGVVRVFINLRAGAFRSETVPASYGQAVALAAGDSTTDAVFDLLVLARDGSIARMSRNQRDGTWQGTPLARVDLPAGSSPGTARLVTADLDNNGASDLIVSGPAATRVLLAAPGAAFAALPAPLALGVHSVGDLDGDGRLEMVGLAPDGRPARAAGKPTKAYRSQTFRPRAATATGDQRINSFGIGGEIEVRSGLHVQKQLIASPVVHVGLGDAPGAEVVRITWPNGVLQAEFDTKANQTVKASQRLKGSCPWLFAWNGREMSFVTDLIWRSPLGLRINAQATADILMTGDWIKLAGDRLAPRDGAYDLRITAELWETHFFDQTTLLAVDHPAGTEVFVDERFAVPPPKLQVVPTGPVQPFTSVRDDTGRDVSALAVSSDSRFIDFAGRGAHQGITRAHFVEMELPDAAPRTGPLWLVARGWIHPTDSSVNVAIGQGAHAAPEGLSLEVADAAGRFRPVRKGLGFPAGKDKTVLIDLAGVFPRTGPRRLRLATNLEIFWDRLGWAIGRPDVVLQPRRLDLLTADLAYRGYSPTDQPSPSVPARPRYAIEGTGQRWRDLEGYYTRFGDVRDLLRNIDDRYVIMNAGDELRLRFREVPPPAPGFVRDFVVIGDGWVKDGDYNTGFSRTVLPLPTHRIGRYDRAPRQLEDDPVYREHPEDFAEYHTRYVTPEGAREALRQGRPARRPATPQP